MGRCGAVQECSFRRPGGYRAARADFLGRGRLAAYGRDPPASVG